MDQQCVLTVLIVDDFNPFSRLMRNALARRGISAVCADTPEKSLALVEAHPERIDLVIADIVSPTAAILDLTAELSRRRPKLPVLYLVGARHSIVRASLEARAPHAVLAVPFSEKNLIERIGGLLHVAVASRRLSDGRLWERLLSNSQRLPSGIAMLHVYEPRQAALASGHMAILRAANLPCTLRPTNYAALPYSLIVRSREIQRARTLISNLSAGLAIDSAA
jgi:DNA-binding NtrC family response regulator